MSEIAAVFGIIMGFILGAYCSGTKHRFIVIFSIALYLYLLTFYDVEGANNFFTSEMCEKHMYASFLEMVSEAWIVGYGIGLVGRFAIYSDEEHKKNVSSKQYARDNVIGKFVVSIIRNLFR